MRRLALSFSVLLFFLNAYSQGTLGGTAASQYEMNLEVGGVVSVVDYSNYDPVGNVYLFEEWKSGKIFLRNGAESGNLVMRINLLNNTIDVKEKEKVRTFGIEKISHLELNILVDSSIVYRNPLLYKFKDKTPVVGLIRPIKRYEENKWMLVERNYLKTIPANYVPALDAGNKQDQYVVSNELYLVKDNTVFPTEGGKRKFIKELPLNSQDSKGLLEFMKQNKLSNKRQSDLVNIVNFMNQQ